MSLVGVGGEFSLKCTNMFPAELWLRLVLNEHTTTMSQLDQCRNQQVKVKDKLEHDFCCRAVLLVKIKASHFSHIFSATLANRLPFIYLFFKYFIIQLFKIFKPSLQMRQRRYLQTVKRAWIMKLQTPGQKCLMSPRSFLCFLFPPSLPLSSVIRCIIQECVHICTQNSFEIESTAPFSEEISKYKFCKSCIILTLNETARDCLNKMMLCFRAQAAVIIFVLVSAPNAPQPSRFLPISVMDDCLLL